MGPKAVQKVIKCQGEGIVDLPRFLAPGAEWVMMSFIDLGDRDWLLPGRQKPRFTSKHSWPCPVVGAVLWLSGPLEQRSLHCSSCSVTWKVC